MKAKREIVLRICFIFLIVLAIAWFALHFIAPNPTHRWYSSDYVDLSEPPNVYGLNAEQILSYDLNLPRNDSAEGERICFCGANVTTPRGRCNMCLVNMPEISSVAIPDFITDELIIDSKAIASTSSLNTQQINTFLLVAEHTDRELWIFVRLDTDISLSTLNRIRATGGDIIPYFVVDGYQSRLYFEMVVNGVLIIIILLSLGAGVWVYIMNRRPDDPSEDSIDEIDKAEDSVNETEEFMKRMERLSKKHKDEDDKRGKK